MQVYGLIGVQDVSSMIIAVVGRIVVEKVGESESSLTVSNMVHLRLVTRMFL